VALLPVPESTISKPQKRRRKEILFPSWTRQHKKMEEKAKVSLRASHHQSAARTQKGRKAGRKKGTKDNGTSHGKRADGPGKSNGTIKKSRVKTSECVPNRVQSEDEVENQA